MPPKIMPQPGLVDSWGRKNIRYLEDRSCERCGQMFRPSRQTSKYCSPACGYSNNGPKSLTIEELFLLIESIPVDENGCKNFDHRDYPVFCRKRKRYLISRLVLEQKLGRPIRDGLFALHSCDNPKCVNKDHIREGSQKQNIEDAQSRGRLAIGDRHGLRKHPERIARGDRSARRLHPDSYPKGDDHFLRKHPEAVLRGEQNGASKLTEDEVRAIRTAKGSLKSIGDRFGIAASTVLKIQRRSMWSHVV